MELLHALGTFISLSWNFFTDINVPGFGFSFAALFVGVFLAVLSLRLLSYMFGFNASGKDDS